MGRVIKHADFKMFLIIGKSLDEYREKLQPRTQSVQLASQFFIFLNKRRKNQVQPNAREVFMIFGKKFGGEQGHTFNILVPATKFRFQHTCSAPAAPAQIFDNVTNLYSQHQIRNTVHQHHQSKKKLLTSDKTPCMKIASWHYAIIEYIQLPPGAMMEIFKHCFVDMVITSTHTRIISKYQLHFSKVYLSSCSFLVV